MNKTVETSMSELFVHSGDVRVKSTAMHHPWILAHSFNFRTDEFETGQLEHLLQRYCGLALDEIKEPLDQIKKGLDGQRNMPNGLLGTENLKGFSGKWDDSAKTVVVGLTGVVLRLQKVGNCLAVSCKDTHDDEHELTTKIFQEIARTWPYLDRYHHRFDISYQLFNRGIDLAAELSEMERRVPSVRWYCSAIEQVAGKLFDQFTDESGEEVQVGDFHGRGVYMSVGLFHDRSGEQPYDANWRRGFIKDRSATALTFRSRGTSPFLVLNYYVKTRTHAWFHDIDHGIDHDTEQSVITEAARAIATGLYDRWYDETATRNPSWVKTRRTSVEGAVT